jgi:D-glycero-alpha-D-manno-heptose 1-phosphate guanylyltransferase
MNVPSDSTAVLLVGGMGTRLRSVVPSVPKPLAAVGDRSFLELLIRQIRYQGIRRIVMCTGFLAEQIENKFGDGRAWEVSIEYSHEEQPLGTAGALKLAQRHLEGVPEFLVLNGDSFLEADFDQLIRLNHERNGLATMAVVRLEDTGRYGTVRVDADGRLVGFAEKTEAGVADWINAGVYVFTSAIFEHIPQGEASLERDVFPRIIEHGVYAAEQRGMFIDIGTPEDYARAQALCERLNDAALRK